MTILLNRPLRPALGESTRSNRYVAHLGTSILPNPIAAAAARTNRSFLVNFMYDNTLIPAAITEPNRKVVTPPRTGFGIERKTPDSLPRTPYRMRKLAQKKPAFRLAHRVKAMTPLFWAKILSFVSSHTLTPRGADCRTHLMGVTVNRAEKKPAIPSASTPPWIRLSNSG